MINLHYFNEKKVIIVSSKTLIGYNQKSGSGLTSQRVEQ